MQEFLDEHAATCRATVETWMLRSHPVPSVVLAAVMPDPAWAAALRDAWVSPIDGNVEGGLLRAVDPRRGLGIVDRDGETRWLEAGVVRVPHPALVDALDDLRDLAVQLGATQGVSQLFRETFTRPARAPGDPLATDAFAGAVFPYASQALQLAKQLGYRVIGGSAVCRVIEGERVIEAHFDLGAGDPSYEATTGELVWLDEREQRIAVLDVPPVAFSEGMRMAALIHGRGAR